MISLKKIITLPILNSRIEAGTGIGQSAMDELSFATVLMISGT